MRPRRLALAVPIAALLAAGCVYTVEPLASGDQWVFERDFLGAWIDSDGTIWTVLDAGDGGYVIAVDDDDGREEIPARLTRIGEHWFADVELGHPEGIPEEGMRPLRTPVRIERRDGGLVVAVLEQSGVQAMLDAGELDLAHESGPASEMGSDLFLTAETPRLRAWLASVADRHELWSETFFRRVGTR